MRDEKRENLVAVLGRNVFLLKNSFSRFSIASGSLAESDFSPLFNLLLHATGWRVFFVTIVVLCAGIICLLNYNFRRKQFQSVFMTQLSERSPKPLAWWGKLFSDFYDRSGSDRRLSTWQPHASQPAWSCITSRLIHSIDWLHEPRTKFSFHARLLTVKSKSSLEMAEQTLRIRLNHKLNLVVASTVTVYFRIEPAAARTAFA